MSKITIWCDGACAGNPGPSGVAYLIRFDDDDGTTKMDGPHREFIGHGTNNEAEIMAALAGLLRVLQNYEIHHRTVEVITDSQYVVKSMRSEWAKKKNLLYWQQLERIAGHFDITWTHEKKGSSNQNRMCDREAVTAIHMGALAKKEG
jgi:ribonuclease HI